jgi:transposase
LEHRRALGDVLELLGDKPVVMDRQFSYQTLFEDFIAEWLNYVIRLNVGSKATVTDEEGKRLALTIAPGEKVVLREVYYTGRVKVNLAGEWKESEPLWVISSLEPLDALAIYKASMKLEESFRDLKSLLNLDKLMNKRQANLEKLIALVLIAYAIGLLVGEQLRDQVYGSGEKRELY